MAEQRATETVLAERRAWRMAEGGPLALETVLVERRAWGTAAGGPLAPETVQAEWRGQRTAVGGPLERLGRAPDLTLEEAARAT